MGIANQKKTIEPEKLAKQTGTGLTWNQIVFSSLVWVVGEFIAGAILSPLVAVLFSLAGGLLYWGTLSERRQQFRLNQASYALGMDCGSDGTLTLYVNGIRIDSIADSTYAKGHVGLFAWSSAHVNAADVNLSNFKITLMRGSCSPKQEPNSMVQNWRTISLSRWFCSLNHG
jgi:hypothetical protein